MKNTLSVKIVKWVHIFQILLKKGILLKKDLLLKKRFITQKAFNLQSAKQDLVDGRSVTESNIF